MKKAVCVLVVLAMSFCLWLLPGCGRIPRADTQNKKSLRIGVSTYDQYDTFISLLTERLHYYAKQKEDDEDITITIIQESANGSQATQNNQVENFIKSGCDIICVNLVDRTDASYIIDKVENIGTPVLFFNRELVAEDLERCDTLYYVGAEALVSGEMQGQLVVNLYKENPEEVDKTGDGIIQYVMLEGEAGHQDAVLRTMYSVNTLTGAGIQVERLDGASASWIRSRAESKMTQWLTQYGYDSGGTPDPVIEVVFANNDDMALGAIDALEKTGVPQANWPVIVGVDGTREGLDAVKKGTMAGTILNNADGQAQALMELSFSLFAGSPLPDNLALVDGKYIRLPYESITPDNVDRFIRIYS